MQFDTNRAFPYPVLRTDVDDYTKGQFQTAIIFEEVDGGANIEMDVFSSMNVPEIKAEIEKGNAEYLYLLACRDTFTRYSVSTKDTKFKRKFAAGHLRGQVKVYKVISVKKPIKGFSCKSINKEFGGGSFDFEPGEILAYDSPTVVYLEPESFKPIVSIFEIAPNDSLDKYDLQFFTQDDRIKIEMSPYFKERVGRARNDHTRMAVLFNSIYFHAVVDALDKLRAEPEGDQRWKKVILHRLNDIDKTVEDLELEGLFNIANELLNKPLSRIDEFFANEADE